MIWVSASLVVLFFERLFLSLQRLETLKTFFKTDIINLILKTLKLPKSEENLSKPICHLNRIKSMITIKTRIDKHEHVSLSTENCSLTINALIKTQRVLQTVIVSKSCYLHYERFKLNSCKILFNVVMFNKNILT